MTRITLTLDDEMKTGLCALAEREYRDPRLQAALIIRKELESQGLITYQAKAAAGTGSSQGSVFNSPGISPVGTESLPIATPPAEDPATAEENKIFEQQEKMRNDTSK